MEYENIEFKDVDFGSFKDMMHIPLEEVKKLKTGTKIGIYDPFINNTVDATFIKIKDECAIVRLSNLGKCSKRRLAKYESNYCFLY